MLAARNIGSKRLWWRLAGFVALSTLCAAGSRAEDLQIWHWWTNEVDLSRKTTLILHSQFRTNRPMADFWQGRGGPIILYSTRPGFYLVGGYYYRRERSPFTPGQSGDSHRYFGGFQQYIFTPATENVPPLLLESRGLVERFAGGPRGTLTDFTRIRYRLRASLRNRVVSPLLGYEVLFDPQGLWANRPHAGVRWNPNQRIMLDVGVYYDARTPRIGRRTPLFFTNLLVRVRKVRDPEFPDRPTF
jgi:hypothetical protein